MMPQRGVRAGRWRAGSWGLHNYAIEAIEAIEEEVALDEWVRSAAFDGYELPPWQSLSEPIRNALVALNDGEPLTWRR